MNFTKNQFINFWGSNGYRESFGSNYPFKDAIEKVLDEYSNKEGVAIDIGCGDGFWTVEFLKPRFNRVIALDVIPCPVILKNNSISYIQLSDVNYDCENIADQSIDFVWCFGLFCHLSNSAVEKYLKSIYRIMKPGAVGLIMFANWKRGHLKEEKEMESFREKSINGGWFYCDIETTIETITKVGLTFVADMIPNFRDTLAGIKKL